MIKLSTKTHTIELETKPAFTSESTTDKPKTPRNSKRTKSPTSTIAKNPSNSQSTPDNLTIIYYPEKDKPIASFAGSNPLALPARHREIWILIQDNIEKINLVPGYNPHINYQLWQLAKEQKATQLRLEWGAIKEIIPTDNNALNTLEKYLITDAEIIISVTYDIQQLKQWQTLDKRRHIYNKIEQRIHEINDNIF